MSYAYYTSVMIKATITAIGVCSPPPPKSRAVLQFLFLILITLPVFSSHSRQPSRRAQSLEDNGERATTTFATEGRETEAARDEERAPTRERAPASRLTRRGEGRWRSARDLRSLVRARRRPEEKARGLTSARRGRSRAPSVFWTRSRWRCGRRSSTTSTRTTSSPWL